MPPHSARGQQSSGDDTTAGATEPSVELVALNANGAKPNVASQQDAVEVAVPTTKKTQEPSKSELRDQAIKALFGLEVSYTKSWPGTLAVCIYLEEQFKDLLDDSFSVIWKIMGREKPQESFQVWYWCLALLKILRQVNECSLDSVYRGLLEQSGIQVKEINDLEKARTLQAIFAGICWMSLALEPKLLQDTTSSPSRFGLSCKSILARDESVTTVQLKQYSSRPTNKLFRGFHELLAHVSGEQTSHTPISGTIYESSINFDSLYTIGRLRVKWTDTMAAHLHWNQEDHTVSIFRFPSFCAATIQASQFIPTVAEVQGELLPSESYVDVPRPVKPHALHRELMLTYRLLFGQSVRSRKLVQDLLIQEKKADRVVDPLLERLCTLPLSRSWVAKSLSRRNHLDLPAALFPQSTISTSSVFMESDSYSAQHDFPVFGLRLLELQKYNLRQQPSRARDLWRDRRNPLQWYTFWAVIWVGGITIVLAVLQLAVGIAQLYFAPG
ncbi:uncharacterized protein J4E84_007350 [Alternaria hordeiaustralica]|uniref:uncharacterized protein n=1 Tax=Alternaria hordeiaustralica TaxID=1187925 RepID=UPI0020C217D0|nr:uncharacterized protein J4E84_007350 [Alternaria hordeiaustralica]KAI4681755.1 hypothetical protein J4E84_007350 [Alternaria hordeiaustralica]